MFYFLLLIVHFPQPLWSRRRLHVTITNTFFRSPERACRFEAASAHGGLQADTHSAVALIKKSAASKVSQSESGALRSSSRFSGEAAVLIFPEPREGGGQIRRGESCIWLSDGGRSGLEMCHLRWACDTAGIISLRWFNRSHTVIHLNYGSGI